VDTLVGRDVFRVRGVPRARLGHEPDHGLHELGVGADDYLFSVDAQRGVLLRSEARFREQPFAVIEITEVAFDADPPPEALRSFFPRARALRTSRSEGKPTGPAAAAFCAGGWQRKGP
jgi:hypothetical protein